MKLHYRLWIVFSLIWLAGTFMLYLLIVHIYNGRMLENQKQVAFSQGAAISGRLSGLIPVYTDRAEGYVDYYSDRLQLRLLLLAPDKALIYDSFGEVEAGTRLNLAILEAEQLPASRFAETDAFGFVQYTLLPIDERGNSGYLLMIGDVNTLKEDLRRFRGQVLVSLVAATAVSFVVFYFVASWFTKPIRQIMRHLQRITPQNRKFEMKYGRKDEMGQLIGEIRKMVEQAAAYEQRQRRFISTSSHELKTPLTTMQMILENLPSLREDPDLFQEYVHDLQQQIEKMRTTVQGMLDVYRMADKPLNLEPVTFQDIRRHIEEQFGPIRESKHIRFRFENDMDALLADRDLFYRGVDNLVSNALRYSPEHTEVAVRLMRHPSGSTFSVCDQGIGISEQDLPYIFEPFYRSNHATRWSQEGSGLGLAIVKQMVELHEGEIKVQSAPGKGTCFHLTFRNK